MKNLMLFLLVVACAGLFFHDKQQSADLARALDENAQLTQQLADKEAAVNGLQLRMQQSNSVSQSAMGSQGFPQAGRGAAPQSPAWMQEQNPLDRPAFRDSGGH